MLLKPSLLYSMSHKLRPFRRWTSLFYRQSLQYCTNNNGYKDNKGELNRKRKVALLKTDVPLISQFGVVRHKSSPICFYDHKSSYTYDEIIKKSYDVFIKIKCVLQQLENTERNPRIAFLCDNNVDYVYVQLAIWLCRGVGVPLCRDHPDQELQYVIEDSKACVVVNTMKVSGL